MKFRNAEAKTGDRVDYLIVDGYNIIFSWSMLKKIADYSLDDARDKLIHILSNYRGVSQKEIIVVFDAHNVRGSLGSDTKDGGIAVVFTRESVTADQYIERTVAKLSKTDSITVATSDFLEQIIVISRGARRISANDLLYDIEKANEKIRAHIEHAKPVKNNLFGDNLDHETAEWFEALRMKKTN